MEKLAIVMPVYNEEEAIGPVLDQWVAAMDRLGIEYTINPYNDGSKDDSLQIIRAKEEQYPGKVIAHTKPNGGHGPTILLGYREAAEAGYDWIFQIDSDDEMGPEGFSELWDHREDYDFLVGIRDGRKQALPRKIISAISRLSVRIFYGKSIWDVNTPYRLMRVSAFREIWNAIPSDTFAPNVIISGMAANKKLRCFETPVQQKDRQTGEVSIRKWKLLRAAVKSFWQTMEFSLKWNNRISYLFFSIVFFISSLVYSPFVKKNHDIDHWVYFLGGKILKNGGKLYTDFFDHKGPFHYLLYYSGELISDNFWGVWGINYFLFFCILTLLFFRLSRKMSPLFSLSVCLLLLGIDTDPMYPESFAYYLSILACSLLLDEKNKNFNLFLCGCLGGCVLFIKQTCIGLFVIIGLYMLFSIRKKGFFSLLAWYIFGGLFSITIFILTLSWMQILGSYYECCYLFNIVYSRMVPNSLVKSVFLCINQQIPLYFIAIFSFIASLYKQKKNNLVLFSLLGFVLWETFFIAKTGRLYPYQFINLKFSLLLVVLYMMYLELTNIEIRNKALNFFIICSFICIAILFSGECFRRILIFPGKLILNEKSGKTDFIRKTSDIISSMPPAGLFVWGNCCELYLQTKRVNPFAPYYYSGSPLNKWIDKKAYRIIEYLNNTSPMIIVDSAYWNENARIFPVNGSSCENSAFVIALRNYITKNCKQIQTADDKHRIYIPKCWSVSGSKYGGIPKQEVEKTSKMY